MKTKLNLLLAIVLLTGNWQLATENCFSQDIHFSQYQYSPLTLNPALAGMYNGDARILTNYKNQWSSIASPYKTFAVSYDAGFMKKKWRTGFLGAGLSVFSDKAGDSEMGTTQFAFSLSSNKTLDKDNDLSAGLQAGFAQRSINYNKLIWENQYNGNVFDPTISSDESFSSNKFIYGDFAAGISWFYGRGGKYSSTNNQLKANAGVALFHINSPKQDFYGAKDDKMYSKLTVYGNMLIGINREFAVLPNILFLKQGPAQEITAGAMLRYILKEESKYTNHVKGAAVAFGGYYRAGDAIVISSQLEVANYALGISYDVNTSELKSASTGRGGFEISLRYMNPNPFNDRKTSTNPSF